MRTLLLTLLLTATIIHLVSSLRSPALRPPPFRLMSSAGPPPSAPGPSAPDPYSAHPSVLPPSTVASLQSGLSAVSLAISHSANPSCTLTPVSKTKPWQYLLPLIHHPTAPCRTFAENYAQECCEKMALVGKELPEGVAFAFIGALQSNKINGLVAAGVGGRLARVETISSGKALAKFNAAIEGRWPGGETLDVLLQVDTSREASKSGLDYEDAGAVTALVRQCREECPRLVFRGLMTIGAAGDLAAFDRLRGLKAQVDAYVNEELEGYPADMEKGAWLSMGMSGDYLDAIEHGATHVRVGSTIFGARDYPAAAK